MKRLWSADELGERWSLQEVDFVLLDGNPDTGKLGLASQLALGARRAAFPTTKPILRPRSSPILPGRSMSR